MGDISSKIRAWFWRIRVELTIADMYDDYVTYRCPYDHSCWRQLANEPKKPCPHSGHLPPHPKWHREWARKERE